MTSCIDTCKTLKKSYFQGEIQVMFEIQFNYAGFLREHYFRLPMKS